LFIERTREAKKTLAVYRPRPRPGLSLICRSDERLEAPANRATAEVVSSTLLGVVPRVFAGMADEGKNPQKVTVQVANPRKIKNS
jgi:hypothetical protein